MSDSGIGELRPGERVLMGPGPSALDPRVLRALATPVVGHLDPDFLAIMNDTRALIRSAFATDNELTVAMSGTGSAGMETCLVNLLEPGDRALVCVNGAFGQRMVDIVERTGAEAVVVRAPWGRVIDPADVEAALKQGGIKLVALVHVETSTGVWQPVEDIAALARAHDALVVLDAVSSLGGVPVPVDQWQVDAAYSGSQKCLGAPPGLAPVTMSPRAREAIGRRRTKVQSWYLDLTMIENYWGEARAYHHTAPISMVYALREALRIAVDEGWEARWQRHLRLGRALQAGLEAMGLSLVAEENHRAPMVTAVHVPDGVNEAQVRRHLLAEYGLEIAGGLGEFKGRALRIGLMGYSCQWRNVVLCLTALSDALQAQGYKASVDDALAAAQEAARAGSAG
ncbi:MAG: alanine--glyoxylate aminotransferase family protein [Limnochordales bacterium]|nr:alanine--glyoxylate aminotransferase family protein [Limnochordales bacterium]